VIRTEVQVKIEQQQSSTRLSVGAEDIVTGLGHISFTLLRRQAHSILMPSGRNAGGHFVSGAENEDREMATPKDRKTPNFFFRFYWNEYANKTSSLTLLQHGAYLGCMLEYYRTGRPLPSDFTAIYRILRAFTPEEQQAVVSILEQFFEKQADGSWRHDRIECELREIEQRRQKSLNSNEKRWHSGRTPSSDPSSYPSAAPSNDPRNDANNSNSNSMNKDRTSENDDQVAAVAFLEDKHMHDIGSWGVKYRPQMEAWIQQYGQTFMDEAITVAKGYGLEGVNSPIAVMVTTHLPKAIAKLNEEKARASQQKKADVAQAESIERQTQEIIARRDARPAVSEVSMEDFLEGIEKENKNPNGK
jgi:uncharacterized protein YdaU (DUF1376 family)